MVDAVRKDPSKFKVVLNNLDRWERTASAGVLHYIKRWKSLALDMEACLSKAIEDSEDGAIPVLEKLEAQTIKCRIGK